MELMISLNQHIYFIRKNNVISVNRFKISCHGNQKCKSDDWHTKSVIHAVDNIVDIMRFFYGYPATLQHQWPLLLTWFNLNPSIDICTVKCEMKLLIHSQTSTVQSLKFGNG